MVSQGCRPIGQPLIVTRSERNVIYELAGRPALERLLELVEALSPEERALASKGLHVGIVVDEHQATFDRGDFLVRGVLGADRDAGAVVVGDEVAVGATVQFHVRDAGTAAEDLAGLLAGPFSRVVASCSPATAGVARCSAIPTTTPPSCRTSSARCRWRACSAPASSARSAAATWCTGSRRRWHSSEGPSAGADRRPNLSPGPHAARRLSMDPIEEEAIRLVRGFAMDAPRKANSGHPGTAMALAPLAQVLYGRVMRHDPSDPEWPDRDRFILSAGHACILAVLVPVPVRLRPHRRRPRGVPAVGVAHAGPSRAPPHARHRGDDRDRSGRASPTASAWPWPSGCCGPSSART